MTQLQPEKVLHINQVLGPFEEANRFYEDVFGAVEYMNSYDEGERRDASLFLVGDTCIELFSPRDDESLLGRNLRRHGPSFHSFEWKVPDLDAAREAFLERGVRITTDRPGSFFMTHPKDCHGLLLELCPHEMANDPRNEDGWDPAPWRNGPLGIDRLNAMSAAVLDVSAAAAWVHDLTGAEPLYEEDRPGIGRAVGFWIGGTALELVEPAAEGPVAEHVSHLGARLRSIGFRVADVDAAAEHLRSKGLRVVPGDVEGSIAIHPDDNYGVLWQFTEAALPDDPRG
jgi:catechol 2,3-dioxygenase-like lactoylglutathione lyase family enzyme